ncbi:NERD domain-containing protein [Pseudidiomarina sediminum]|uniref:NERD domain-containing protein n=1 Tax=Pseudidiomarina sediminum TaxID=431675 RepID=A0A432Z2Q2_9GAMM|nr:nuclease-related domain-containing protein [Pseudidiomarina sediminum]RUO72155.1 NERD domain-containing protein [Pseudidiomarina sediminum]
MTKSPIKHKPWRTAGSTLQNRLTDIALGRVLLPYAITVFVVLIAAKDWSMWALGHPPNPWVMTIIAIITALISIPMMFKGYRDTQKIKLGIEGEQAVGEFLDRLRAQQAQVFHDIDGDNFNLDHVVITQAGIFVIETKTMSKPKSGKPELQYDGNQIMRGRKPIMGDPVTQVTANCRWLKELLKETTGKDWPIKGVVVFPGWFVKRVPSEAADSGAWVLNPKAFPAYLSNEPVRLRDDEVFLAAFHLSKYIRAR